MNTSNEQHRVSPGQCVKLFCRSPMFWVLITAIVFRGFIDPQGFLDPTRHGQPNAESPDVSTYLESPKLAAVVFQGDVNTTRTPVYPLFIDMHRRLVGEEHLLAWIVFSQRMISLISVFFFYRTAEYCIGRKRLVATAALAYIGFVSILLFNNWILTESLAVSGVVIWFYCFVIYVQMPSRFKACFVGLGVFLLIMLRPAFIGLLLLMFLFWLARLIIRRENFKSDLAGLLSTSVSLILILIYSSLVFHKTGIFSVTVLGASNQYVCVLQSGLFQKDDSDYSRHLQSARDEYMVMFPEKADDPRLLNGQRIWTYPEDPITFMMQKLREDGLLPPLKDRYNYAKMLIKTHKVEYAGFVLGKFMRQTILFPVYLLIVMEAVLILFQWKNTGHLPVLRCVFWLMVAGLLFTAIVGAQDEYLRLALPVMPFVIIIPFRFLDETMTRYAFHRGYSNEP